MEISAIKQQLTIDQILSHYNLKSDRNNMLNCPFHEDKTPSLQIYPKTNTFCCFSSNCTAGTGDVIDLIQLKEKCTKHEAIQKAKSLLGYTEPKPQPMDKPVPSTSAKAPADRYEKLFKVFQTNLAKSKKAKDYLKERNLTTINTGYNSTGWSQLKYCVIYPLKNKEGEIISFYGRSVQNDTTQSPATVGRHYYTKNRKGLYPHYPNSKTETLILTESIIDTATLLQQPEITKQHNVLACYGTNGLTTEHMEAMSQLKALTEIILFFDGDAAGKEAVLKNGQKLKNQHPHVKISYVETPEGEDINSLSISHETEIFTHLLATRKILTPGEERPRAEEAKSQLDSTNPEYITYRTGQLIFTLLGGINLHQLDRMKVTLRTAIYPNKNPLQAFRHSPDLYNDDHVEKYIRKACEKLNISTSAMSEAMAELIHQLEDYRWKQVKEKQPKAPKKRQLTTDSKQKALDYLKAPELMKRTNEDIGKTGIVGEENNRLLMYLVFMTRLLKKPLHVICLGASGTGKTYLQECISELIPEQDKVELTSSSENAFYYFQDGDLSHKLVLIEDMDGIEHILYPVRELQSKTRISKSVPLKDSKGNLKTVKVEVKGPICLAGTTTKERIYQDNADRCLLIYLDNSAEQQQKIMSYQRKLSAGKVNATEEAFYKEQFKDIQAVLRTVKVVNPYAEQLTIPAAVLKPLRTNAHYLAFIEAITFYHQYQRPLKTDREGNPYIETTKEDIQWANHLLKDVLLAKSDELSGACRSFLEKLKNWLKAEEKQSFYAKEIRQAFRINPDNLKYYLRQLHKYGQIKITGGNRYRKGYEYELEQPEEYEQLKTNVSETLKKLLQAVTG